MTYVIKAGSHFIYTISITGNYLYNVLILTLSFPSGMKEWVQGLKSTL